MKALRIAMLGALLSLEAVCVFGTYSVSVDPVQVMTSWYDYMIGGYNDLPMQEIPPLFGGGRIMTYHARRTSNGIRKVYFTYINDAGQMQTVTDPWIDASRNMGYPSIAMDRTMGKPFYAWHENHDTDNLLEVVSFYENFPVGFPGHYSPVQPIFDPPVGPPGYENDHFIWPSIQTGPSPIPGMRRVYILGRNQVSVNNRPSPNVLIAHADYDDAMLLNMQSLNWSYTTIPELDDWHVDNTQIYRRLFGSFAVGNDGNIYYAGYHFAVDPATFIAVNEPDLDVFVCDNYGQGTWQRHSFRSKVPSYNPYNPIQMIHAFNNANGPIPDEDIFYDISNSSHFNAVIDRQGKLHVPGLWTLKIDGLVMTNGFNTVKEFVFDPVSTEFEIREIFPIAGTSRDDFWWMPWDADGDYNADVWHYLQPQPEFTCHFPFCHWDENEQSGAMYFHYNYVRITEDDASGTMACLWQDSQKARYYNLYPADYPEYAAYEDSPEIYLAVSFDRGQNWQEPIVLSAVNTAQLSGMTPMWVYPSNRFMDVGATEESIQKRLYLMFMDDNMWGPTLPPIISIDWGNIKYMALDLSAPVSVDDPQTPQMPFAVLHQNYPNPFNPSTTIAYQIPESGNVRLEVYNLKGQKVRTLINESKAAGMHSVVWNGTDQSERSVASGIFIYRLITDSNSSNKRMLLLK
ncbi:MAG: T9SS type A sorting domain-containing protein [Candidatus Cloacimonadaceae bacterium]|nr:T9SS type A sorting domain-containing protein [Candidatus Cloacimonadaceae bacterium]